jgi:hypothetical protein
MFNRCSRRGFALPVAVFALVVVGVLVTGGFYLARQETRIGVASERATTAFYLAERGAMDVMADWDMSVMGALANWGSTTLTDSTDEGVWNVRVTRMSPRLYFLLATGTVREGSAMFGNASRILGITARVSTADIDPPAALSTIGSLTVGGTSYIIGHDSVPNGWGGYCGPSNPAKPGVLIDSLSNVNTVGVDYEVEGNPPFGEKPNMTADSLLDFGDLGWNDLVAMADIVFPSKVTITKLGPDSTLLAGSYRCNTSNNRNWGDPRDPTGACGSYFPIIYAADAMSINAGDYGQGILLVENDLAIQGGFTFYGPVIVRGTLSTAGTGGHFNGGVIAANVNLETSTVLGNALVQYSSCAVTRAILNNANLSRARPLEDRSWVDLTSVISG